MQNEFQSNPWFVGLIVLIVGIIATIIPILYAFSKKVKLIAPKDWFQNSTIFGDELKQRLTANESRIQGTLVFWKNNAEAHRLLHISNIFWGILSAGSLPVLVQYYEKNDIWAQTLMTVFTFWTGLLFAFARTLKSEEKYQGFRAIESEYYDITRELLDSPERDINRLKELVDSYFVSVEKIRQAARRVETSSPPTIKS